MSQNSTIQEGGVKTLLTHGADFHLLAQDGHTPMNVAESLHHDQVASALKQAGETD